MLPQLLKVRVNLEGWLYARDIDYPLVLRRLFEDVAEEVVVDVHKRQTIQENSMEGDLYAGKGEAKEGEGEIEVPG